VQGGQRRLLTYGGGQRTISARFYLREASLRLVRACLSLGFLPTLFWRPLPPFPPQRHAFGDSSPRLHAHDSIASTIISCAYAVLARLHLVPFMHGVHDISSTAFTATTSQRVEIMTADF
jgi:hypothetical protein